MKTKYYIFVLLICVSCAGAIFFSILGASTPMTATITMPSPLPEAEEALIPPPSQNEGFEETPLTTIQPLTEDPQLYGTTSTTTE